MSKLTGWLIAIAAAYLVLGNVLHHWAFPQPAPDPATFPRAGDVLHSEYEGFHQRIVEVVDDWIISELRLEPGAIGPPLHYHRTFAEEFTVVSGTLHVELADGVMTIDAGESYRVEPLVVHRPFNPGTEPVIVASTDPIMPQSFAACLAQIYPLLDAHDGASFALLLQFSIIDPICDTSMAAIPTTVQTAINLLLAPAARVLGYRNYDPHRALHAAS
jgi:mannose-6-phosphate isomerase-like protein (cupin superfamily)